MMRQLILGALVAGVVFGALGSFAHGGETKAAQAAETAGDKVGEAADKTAAEANKAGRKVKRKTKKVVRQTGAALDSAADKIEDGGK
jgi:hypothetical protein